MKKKVTGDSRAMRRFTITERERVCGDGMAHGHTKSWINNTVISRALKFPTDIVDQRWLFESSSGSDIWNYGGSEDGRR